VTEQISVAISVGLWVGGALLAFQLSRAPDDVPLRYFAAVVLLLAVQHSLVIVQDDTSATVRLASNLMGVAAGFLKVGFFLTALHGDAGRRIIWRREAVLAGLVAVVATTAWALAPADIRAALGQPRNGAHPAAFVFVVSIIGYLASVSVRTIIWTVRLVPRLRRSAFRAGLVLVGAAAVLTLGAGVAKLGTALGAFAAGRPVPELQALYPVIVTLAPGGFVVFLLGATVPMIDGAVRAAVAGVRNRSTHRRLGPLWTELHGAYPDLTLRAGGGTWRRCYRRVVEIRDALVQLAPFYDRDVAAAAGGTGAAADDVRMQAALVRAALAARRDARPAGDPHPIPASGAHTWQEEVDWLVALAAAFRSEVGSTGPPPGRVPAARDLR
jgi:hypothetical protein